MISTFLAGPLLSCANIVAGANGAAPKGNSTSDHRGTCANPSTAVPFVQAFSHTIKAHTLATRAAFAIADTTQGDWEFQGEAFLAWQDPQPSTVPLYRFLTQTNQDYIFTTSPDSNPPSVPGFALDATVGYVYRTRVCGSVPLLGVWNQDAGDHFYTTSEAERDTSLKSGWVDAGVAAYVFLVNYNGKWMANWTFE